MPRIDRCVCAGHTFADLLALARRNGWSLHELAECTGATTKCGRCEPYLRHTLHAGQVVFHHLLNADKDHLSDV